jgi:hypothetical protein
MTAPIYGIGNTGFGLGQAQIYDRVNSVNGIPILLLLIIRSNGNTDNKQ